MGNVFGEHQTALMVHAEDMFSPGKDAAALNLTIQYNVSTAMPPHESLEPFEEKRLEQPPKQK